MVSKFMCVCKDVAAQGIERELILTKFGEIQSWLKMKGICEGIRHVFNVFEYFWIWLNGLGHVWDL